MFHIGTVHEHSFQCLCNPRNFDTGNNITEWMTADCWGQVQ